MVARFAITLTVLLALGLGVLAVLALSGKTIRLPVWAVAEVESRLNTSIRGDAANDPAMDLSLGGVEIVVGQDWVPRFRLEDVKLRRADGQTIVTLPEARIALDPTAFASGQLRPKSMMLTGAQLSLRRNTDGRFDLAVDGAGAGIADAKSFAALLDTADAAFLSPALQSLSHVDVEGLSLTITDARANRRWEIGDGRLAIERRADDIVGELRLTLIEGGKAPAAATIGITTALRDSSARLTASVNDVAAEDIAVLAAPLAALAVLDAPISGRLAGTLAPDGALAALEGELDLGAGALRPDRTAAPLTFEKAGISLTYDPATADIVLQRLAVESRTVRLDATGHIYLRDAKGRPLAPDDRPQTLLGQIRFSDLQVDPEGLFESPVQFSRGALDTRVTLDPFGIEIGQLALEEAGEHLLLSGAFGVSDKGWTSRVDVALDRIRHDRLMALWPLQLVPKTRAWLVENVQAGDLFNVAAALRSAPGQEPQVSLGYEFAGIDVRFLRSLPPIKQGYGRASVEGSRYVMALDRGHVMAPEGGMVTTDGSIFEVPNITLKPTRAKISLKTDASLTATLSMLDQPPFRFATKAGQPVNLAEGRATLETSLSLPLVPKVQVQDVVYASKGKIRDVTSEVIVPGRKLTADVLDLTVTRTGLTLEGPGQLDGANFDVTYRQGFQPDDKGKSQVAGKVKLTDAALRAFGVDLPQGTLSGEAEGNVDLVLVKGQPGKLRLTSSLEGMTVRIPALGWEKSKDSKADLTVEMRLGPRPEVTSLTLSAPGLTADGAVTLREGGGLDVARFATLKVGDWLDAGAEIAGRGQGRSPEITLTGGSLDLRKMPELGTSAGDPDAAPLSLQLDRVVVSNAISLTDFRGRTLNRGGLSGDFVAGVNGLGRIQGTILPQETGSTIRILSRNAGQILAAAGIFSSGRGGALDLLLQSRGAPGVYDGTARISTIRVVDMPALAELLNAVSVIGILEQLNGDGLLFSDVDIGFRMQPGAVAIRRGSAIGASMGVSFAGLYNSDDENLDMQGVVSPFYILNGIGSVLTRRGEGLFGFNYRLRGRADDPQVSVNPLSILTPGMFREIFRASPPELPKTP